MPTPPPDRRVPSPLTEKPLLAWLIESLPESNRTRLKQLLRHGFVHVNGSPITRHDHPIHPADAIAISHTPQAPKSEVELNVIHEDESIVVIDKPCGLLAVATDLEKLDTAFARLAGRDAPRPFVVHRLDRDTSGLLLFAKSPDARDRLQQNWKAVEKTYLAIVEGVPRPAEGTIENFLIEGSNLRVRVGRAGTEAKQAITQYRVVGSHGSYSRVEVKLVTGRKHQIRVHLAGLGCPVIGDNDYGAKTNPARRLGLHAWKLAFTHPLTGERLNLESPVPEALSRIVRA